MREIKKPGKVNVVANSMELDYDAGIENDLDKAYNEACNDWEKWLPSVEQIAMILKETEIKIAGGSYPFPIDVANDIPMAKAVHNRIFNEKSLDTIQEKREHIQELNDGIKKLGGGE